MASVTVVTCWGSQEPLSGFFVSHYSWVDRIIALIGPGKWTGPTYPNVEFRGIPYPGNKFSEYTKRDAINETIRGLDSDWAVVADADEYLFWMDRGRPEPEFRSFLEAVHDENVVMASMWNVYPHADDLELDPTMAPVLQRRHGDLLIDPMYVKPIVVRPSAGFRFVSGQHRLFVDPGIKISSKRLAGVHWKNADLRIAVERKRIRETAIHPLQRRYDEPDPIALCQRHLLDPQLF